jgi:hypothetical protein
MIEDYNTWVNGYDIQFNIKKKSGSPLLDAIKETNNTETIAIILASIAGFWINEKIKGDDKYLALALNVYVAHLLLNYINLL